MSLFGKLVTDARGAAHKDIPRELTWSNADIAQAVLSGELTIQDFTERVQQWGGGDPVSLALAYACQWKEIMPRIRWGWTKHSAPKPSSEEQALLVELTQKGQVSPGEIDKIAIMALRAGAEDALLALTNDWPKGKLADLLKTEQTYAGDDAVSLAHASAFLAMHKVIRAALRDGLGGDFTSGSGQGFGHFLFDTEILPDLKAAGLDPNHVDAKGRSAKAYWPENRYSAAKQKELAKGWDQVFQAQQDKDQDKQVLIFELEQKSKTLVAQQCKSAGIKPGQLVDGVYLTEHAARSLLLLNSTSYIKTNSGHIWLLEQIPKEDLPEQIWLKAFANGMRQNRADGPGPKYDICRKNSALLQFERMDMADAYIRRLTQPDYYRAAWDKVYYGLRGEGATRKPQDELLVDDDHWRAWWSAPDQKGVARILTMYENFGAIFSDDKEKSTYLDRWQIIEAFFQDLRKLPTEKQEEFFAALPPHPDSGMGAWVYFAFMSLFTCSGPNYTDIAMSHFPSNLRMVYAAINPALMLDYFWGKGARPNEAQTMEMIALIEGDKHRRETSQHSLEALQAHLLSLQTQGAAGKAGRRRL